MYACIKPVILFYFTLQTAVEEKQGITQLERVVEEISEAERAKEQRKENKRLKKKKRKVEKAKLNAEKVSEEKIVELVEEEEDEKCPANGNGDDDSCDGSEKSSSDLVVSPRKADDEDDDEDEDETEENSSEIQSDSSPKLSPMAIKSSDILLNEAVACSDSGESTTKDGDTGSTCNDDDESVFGDLSPKCKHDEENDKNVSNGSCKSSVQQQPSSKCTKNGTSNSCNKDSQSSDTSSGKSCSHDSSNRSTKGWCEICHSKPHRDHDHKPEPCKCDKPLYPNNTKSRNGFVTSDCNSRTTNTNCSNHYKLNNGHKKNGYIDCRNFSTVGPRFSRYEEQRSGSGGGWKTSGGGNDGYVDVYDKFHMSGTTINGRGRGGKKRENRAKYNKVGFKCLLSSVTHLFT